MAEKGAMTVREAGRRGGTTTRQRHGEGFYKSIGKKGGDTTKKRHGREHYEKMGKKGGATVKRLVALGKRLSKG